MAYVMSDIHGEYKAYQELLKKIDFSLYEHISDFLLPHMKNANKTANGRGVSPVDRNETRTG